ncbi:hypothetical protein SAMN04487944_10731 [Gracilibacillus ureilyticus]|uniref:Protein required for attachment to host cells n=1 Tax=Gracilibacillus ureilyticus TaxID=531814 RepID=A0A1H9QP62_9BACI|nr:VLRF1 family aeRF1-type release factor [Gracilibacillus ureilyticus]SER61629.1 hypothetical protein SAMN04487944_10731 [Gracilibacillus ureilyticus]
MNLHEEIKKLENVRLGKPNRIFTMYLNTDRADPEQQGGEWKIHLKNGLRNFESYLQEDGDSDEKRNFWAVKEKVEKYIKENEQSLAKSVVIFATGDGSIWFAEKFQLPVKTVFEWDDVAHTDQLKEMYDTFPKSGIILTQKEAVKVLDTELGSLKDSHVFEFDIETEDWREYAGPPRGQASLGPGGRNSQPDQFKERFDANRYRWYKSLASTLDRFAKGLNWENIYLVGDKEEVNDLKENMNKKVTKVVGKNMLDHEEMKIINEVVLK